MYICIDVGGTKTLIAIFDDSGNIVEQNKIQTSQDYQEFLAEVKRVIESFKAKDFNVGIIGIPATRFDRQKGTAANFGNLPWRDVKIAEDIKNITNCPIFIENDAKLAGLSEATLVKDQYSKVLYITISTGIGVSFVSNLQIDVNAGDSGGRVLPIKKENQYVLWESFASGNAIVEKYGKMAKDIDDLEIWSEIAKNIASGLIYFIAIFQPEVIIVGGAVGRYFDRFGQLLKEALDAYQLPLIEMPQLIGATRPEEAVIYGCYELAKQKANG